MLPFCCHGEHYGLENPVITGIFVGVKLFPLNSSRRLTCHIINHPGHPRHLIHNPIGRSSQHLIGHLVPVRRHKVCGVHGPECHGFSIAAAVAHDSYAPGAGEHGEVLADFTLKPGVCDLLAEDGIRLLEGLHPVLGYLADDTHRKARSREGLPPY